MPVKDDGHHDHTFAAIDVEILEKSGSDISEG